MGQMNFEQLFGDNSRDYFEILIKKYHLKPNYVVYQNEQDEVIIDEKWSSSDTDKIKANRIFKFDPLFLDLIDENKKQEVLEKVIELYVSIEDYENAAFVRDILNFNL